MKHQNISSIGHPVKYPIDHRSALPEISSDPDHIKSHFAVIDHSHKGQVRYRCLTCSHEFSCNGRNRLIHHLTGMSPSGAAKHVKPCPNPHQPLKDALINQINQEFPAKKENLLRRRKLRELMDLSSSSSKRLRPSGGEIAIEGAKENPSASTTASDAVHDLPKERVLKVLQVLEVICPEYFKTALFIDQLQHSEHIPVDPVSNPSFRITESFSEEVSILFHSIYDIEAKSGSQHSSDVSINQQDD